MIERIIDISDGPARLHFRNGLLVIEREAQPEVTVPAAEVAALVVAHPRVTFTQSAVSGLADAGGILITCDERFLPAAMLLTLRGHFVQAGRFAEQARASLPTRKQVWQQLVRAKVTAQGRLLKGLYGDDLGLLDLVSRVRSGDAANVEARAAQRYWRALFSDEKFRRDPDGMGPNALLNYGYAVLRAVITRALCASGLHPSLGVHHHNRYDTFCLSDDVMEPFRPVVDRAVAEWVAAHGIDAPLDREAKAALILSITTRRFELEDEWRTLFDVAARTAASLASVFAGKSSKLLLPEI